MRRSRTSRTAGLGVALALALAAAVAARGGATGTLAVEAPPELERQAAAVRAIGAGEWGTILDLVGLASPGVPIRVVLAPERSPLATRVASWVSGYAVPALDTVVLFPARVPSYPDRTMESLVRHEIAHVLVARAAGGAEVPRWFNEGVATVAAREWGIEDSARTALASVGPVPRSLRDVDREFSQGGKSAARAYATSAALVRDLLRRHGDDAVARILARVARGAEFDEAFEAAAGEGPDELARAWFRREALWTTWVPFVTSTTVLWMAITLLALLAIRRRRERDAKLREVWALEEMRGRLRDRGPEDEDDPSGWN